MSQQTLNLRRSAQIVRRHRFLVGIVAALGLLAGGAYTALNPPALTSTALVVLPPPPQTAQAAASSASGATDPYTATQEVIADSSPVLAGALPGVRPARSIGELRQEVNIGSLTPYVISVSATGKVAADVEATANAIANSYINYIGSSNSPVGHVPAKLLQPATSVTGPSLLSQLVIYALIGVASGALLGAIVALAIGRGDRRLRERDEIADSITVPVLGSFPVGHPSNPGEWNKLLADYQPAARHALQLRKVLQQLEMVAADADAGAENGRWSFTVLSLSSDPGALALGPQLAAFAASQDVPTALVIGPQQDVTVTASLRTACSAPPTSSERPGHLQVIVSDNGVEEQPDAALTVVVAVVDSRHPRVPDTIRTAVTLLGVSAGVATADELARAAVSAAAVGCEITGIIVANPDPADATTGRSPQLGQPGQRGIPARMNGIPTGIRQ